MQRGVAGAIRKTNHTSDENSKGARERERKREKVREESKREREREREGEREKLGYCAERGCGCH